MNDREYLTALYSFSYFGPARTGLLVRYFGSAKKAWNVSLKELIEIGINENRAKEFIDYRDDFNFKEYFGKLVKQNIKVITLDDPLYPENLKGINDAPLVLYLRGNLSKNDVNALAIVGSRKITAYGREVTQKFATELANLGITIVSGLAFGVDLEAHKSTLDAGGRCIAVLAGGIDVITPRSNEWLGMKIIKSGGAILSEFPPGVLPQKHFFPYRNRIISGLAKGVIIIEGMIKSGTIHTAHHAAKQGRQVFAVPGQVTSPMSGASHYLIKNGAVMLTEVNDILTELDLQLKIDRDAVGKSLPADENEEKLINILANEPLHLDEVARISTLATSIVSARLTIMELKGLVKNLGGGVYKKIS